MNNLDLFNVLVGTFTIIGGVVAIISLFKNSNQESNQNKQSMIGGSGNQQANGDIKNESK